MKPVKQPDLELRRKIDNQAERIEELLGLPEETIWTDGERGIVLTPSQVDGLLALIHQTPPPDPCKCRCKEGKHCGGCGHPGCGFPKDSVLHSIAVALDSLKDVA